MSGHRRHPRGASGTASALMRDARNGSGLAAAVRGDTRSTSRPPSVVSRHVSPYSACGDWDAATNIVDVGGEACSPTCYGPKQPSETALRQFAPPPTPWI